MRNKDESRTTFILIIILIAAFTLRIIHLGSFSLSNDELSALSRLRFDSFHDLVINGFYIDGHPGGIQVFLFYWTKLFGNSPFSVRLPFVLMGVGAVFFIFKTAKEWFGDTSGLVAASLLATLQFPLLYSRIARPYGSGLFFILLLAWIWTRLLTEKQDRKIVGYGIAYAFANALCMYNHYFSFFLAFIIGITGLFFLNKKNYLAYLAGAVGAVILFVPHIPITINHLSIGGVGEWLGVPDTGWIFKHILYIFNESLPYLIVIVVFCVVLLTGKYQRTKIPYRLIAVGWFLLPALTGFLYSKYVNPVLQDSVLIFSMPFLILFISGFACRKSDRIAHIIIIFLLFFGIIHTTHYKRFYTTQHFNEFKGVAEDLMNTYNIYDKKDISAGISINHPWYLEYYTKDSLAYPFSALDIRNRDDFPEFSAKLHSLQKPYYFFAWTKPVPSEIIEIIKDDFPFITFRKSYQDLSESILFTKDSLAKKIPEKQADTTVTLIRDGSTNIAMDSTQKYGKVLIIPVSASMAEKGFSLIADGTVTSIRELQKAEIVISLNSPEDKTKQWHSALSGHYYYRGNKKHLVRVISFNPEDLETGDAVKAYMHNPGAEMFSIEQLNIKIYEN